MHVAASVAFNDVPLTEQAVPVTEKLTAPVPDPPDDVSTVAIPAAIPVIFVFDTVSTFWATEAASPRITGAALYAALPPHPARNITVHATTAPAAFPLSERGPNILN
jgi:hypothetical protein